MATPILDSLIASGVITMHGDTPVGVASDGVEVAFSTNLQGAELYLTDFPTPEMW